MKSKKITPESLRSDAAKMLVRADAMEQKLTFFSGKLCEFCGESKRFVNSARCVNTRVHVRDDQFVENLRQPRVTQLSARPWR